MRIGRRSSWFTARAMLAMFAIVVQALLPFVVAADIAAAAGAPPICHVPSGDHHKSGQPNPVNSCPICTALAAAGAITSPTPPAIPVPRFIYAAIPVSAAQNPPDLPLATSYHSRAPPAA
jgi:hypothetical protein